MSEKAYIHSFVQYKQRLTAVSLSTDPLPLRLLVLSLSGCPGPVAAQDATSQRQQRPAQFTFNQRTVDDGQPAGVDLAAPGLGVRPRPVGQEQSEAALYERRLAALLDAAELLHVLRWTHSRCRIDDRQSRDNHHCRTVNSQWVDDFTCNLAFR